MYKFSQGNQRLQKYKHAANDHLPLGPTYLDQSLPWVAPPHPRVWRSTSGGRRHADLWGSPGNKEWKKYTNVSLLAACVGQAWVGSLYHVPCWNARFCCCEHSHSLHDTRTYDIHVGIAVVSFMKRESIVAWMITYMYVAQRWVVLCTSQSIHATSEEANIIRGNTYTVSHTTNMYMHNC